MAQNRPDKPNITLPDNFGGTQTAFSSSLVESGYEASIPQIIEGGNLNWMLNGFFQNTKYMRTVLDYVRDTPIGKMFWVNQNGQMDYVAPAIIGSDAEFSTGTSTTKTPNIKQVVDNLALKQATITGAATTITGSNLTINRALIANSSGKVAVSSTTSTELGYLSGVTSAIQTQIDNTVKTSGNQTISGTKTFSSTIDGSINGNAATVTNGVYTTGNQTIGGTKTFSSSPLVPTASTSDNSTKSASTAFVKAQGYVPASSFEEVNVVVEAYQGTSDWYRVWSDGWIEQGGKSSSRSWTYPKPFSSATSYTIISNNSATTDGYGRPDIIDCTATGATADVNAAAPILWIAMGK